MISFMLIVKDSFFWNGVLFRAGHKIDASDPVVTGRRHLFVDVSLSVASVASVEAATAVPGEKRSSGKKKAAASRSVQSRANID